LLGVHEPEVQMESSMSTLRERFDVLGKNARAMYCVVETGSTENTTVVTELLSNLVARGLRVEHSMLFVIDGGKAIRKALRDVFGDRAIVQRCQVHKARNVRDQLPEARRAYGDSKFCSRHRS